MSLNSVSLQGRLVRDPETRQTSTMISVTSFCMAVDRDYKSADGERQTDFINVTAWRATGEFVQNYFRKGNAIVVQGRLQSRSWTADDGSKRTSFEVVADNVYFCEKRIDTTPHEPRYEVIEGEDEVLPF